MNRLKLAGRVAFVLVAFILAALFAAPATAAQYCTADSDCPGRTVCVDKKCVLDSEVDAAPKPDPSAERECSSDRRCRIRRLARRNRARRMTQSLYEEERLQSLIESREQRRKERIPRESDPFTIDIHASPVNETGFMAGYSITPQFRAEATVHFPYHSIWENFDTTTISGEHDFTLISVGPTYYFSDSTYSFYTKGAFLYGTGTLRLWNERGSSNLDTVQHALSFGGGFDMQFELGFHARLGLMYRFLLFNQAAREPGSYHEFGEEALEADFEALDAALAIGWAF